jgi:branched-chain amino acid transport system ATP-binding protein
VSGLCAGYDGRTVLHDLDLEIDEGEVVCLLGANGAGKSTALGAMTGLVRATAGEVTVDGRPLPLTSTNRIGRAGIAHVPEDRSLFPSLTVREHLRLADGRAARRRGPDVDASATALGWFPALEPLLTTRVGLLSGGEQQMVAVARAAVGRPRVLLIDEMSLGLAPLVVRSLLEVIARLAADTGCAVLLVEQHVALALDVASRAYVLRRGRVQYSGPASDLAADHDALVAGYLG